MKTQNKKVPDKENVQEENLKKARKKEGKTK